MRSLSTCLTYSSDVLLTLITLEVLRKHQTWKVSGKAEGSLLSPKVSRFGFPDGLLLLMSLFGPSEGFGGFCPSEILGDFWKRKRIPRIQIGRLLVLIKFWILSINLNEFHSPA